MRAVAARWPALARAGERGAAAVELALIVPLVLVLLFGAIDLGLMVAVYNSTSEAARDGARAAQVMVGQGHASILSATEQDQIRTDADRVTSPLTALTSSLTVTPSMEPDANGHWFVKVTVTTVYQPMLRTFVPIGDTTLTATSKLAVPCGAC